MDVSELTLRSVLEGRKQYVVPLYQRRYSWEHKNHRQLWDDILMLTEHREAVPHGTHFTGSLVLSVDVASPGATTFLVVDGQQRLTTLTVMLAALRDHWAEEDEAELAEEIGQEYLTNRYVRAAEQRLKVVPTKADQELYASLLNGAHSDDPTSLLDDAYRYFRGRIREAAAEGTSLESLRDAVLDGLIFVSIVARGDDNVYRIFESLNNTGVRLSQADLVRNLVFMNLGDAGEPVYQQHWLPMQAGLSDEDLTNLFWFDLVWEDHLIPFTSTYEEQKRRIADMSTEQIIDFVEVIARRARSLKRMRQPQLEDSSEVQFHLYRLREWGASVTDPLVLRVLDLRESQACSSAEAAAALGVLESYLVRRFLVHPRGQGLNRILAEAAGKLSGEEPPADALRRMLSEGRKYFATDAEVREAVLNRPFFTEGAARIRRLVLTWLIQLAAGKEHADLGTMSIEHVMPQTDTPSWVEMLAKTLPEGADVTETYGALVHTLGNLTFSGYNSELSNKPFAEKRKLLAGSALTENHRIASNERWGYDEIRARGEELAARAIAHWSGPDPNLVSRGSGKDWRLHDQIIAHIPEGFWTSYYELAQAVESHPIAVGQRIASHPVEGAWRVMTWDGRASAGFAWPDGSPHEGRDVVDVLREEGIRFGDDGKADKSQQLGSSALLALVGAERDDDEFGGENE